MSFSLDEDNNINSHLTLTTFNPNLPDKYDAIPEKERGKIKIVKNIQNIPDPFMENNNLSARETESIENEDTFWEDWDNQK